MDNETKLKVEESIVEMLKTVYDPEIPVNVYDLGLIYKIDLQDDGEVVIDMTLTAPNCPAVSCQLSLITGITNDSRATSNASKSQAVPMTHNSLALFLLLSTIPILPQIS